MCNYQVPLIYINPLLIGINLTIICINLLLIRINSGPIRHRFVNPLLMASMLLIPLIVLICQVLPVLIKSRFRAILFEFEQRVGENFPKKFPAFFFISLEPCPLF